MRRGTSFLLGQYGFYAKDWSSDHDHLLEIVSNTISDVWTGPPPTNTPHVHVSPPRVRGRVGKPIANNDKGGG